MQSTGDITATETCQAGRPARPAFECPQCGADVEMPGYADAAICAFCGSTLTRPRRTGEGAAPTGEKRSLRSVQCSQCAGPLSAFEGRRILVCDRCGVRVAVLAHDGFSRWWFPCRLTKVEAAETASRWLAEHPGIDQAARSSRLLEAQLIYAPIWEHKVLVAGWEFGYKMVTKAEAVHRGIPGSLREEETRLELRTVKEGVKEPYLQERRYFEAATDFASFGGRRPRLTGRELMLPMLAGEIEPGATVLAVQGNAETVAETGRMIALQPMSGAHSLDAHLTSLRESTALLYHPMWVLLFRAGERYSKIVVNGRDGSVNSAVAPASNRARLALLVARVAALAVVVAVLVTLAATRSQGRSSLVAAAVIVSLVAVVMVWRFKPVREVEYHDVFSS